MGRALGAIVMAAIAASFLSWAPAHKKTYPAEPWLSRHAEQAQFYCAQYNGIVLIDLVGRLDDGLERANELKIRLLSFPEEGGCEIGVIGGGHALSVPVVTSGMHVEICRAHSPDDLRKWVYYLPLSKLGEKTRC